MHEDWLKYQPYELGFSKKQKFLIEELNSLNKRHLSKCESFFRILRSQNLDSVNFKTLEAFPFLPVKLFKNRDLIPDIKHVHLVFFLIFITPVSFFSVFKFIKKIYYR